MVYETEVERSRRLLNEKYSGAKVDFKESSAWTKWKELDAVPRFFIGSLIIFAVIIGVFSFIHWVN